MLKLSHGPAENKKRFIPSFDNFDAALILQPCANIMRDKTKNGCLSHFFPYNQCREPVQAHYCQHTGPAKLTEGGREFEGYFGPKTLQSIAHD